MPFDPLILQPDPEFRRQILPVLEAALAAVDPYAAVQAILQRKDDLLTVGDRAYDLSRYRRVLVIGAGKAGAPMAQAVESLLGDRIADGLVVVKHEHGGETQRVRIAEASHPVPDAAGVQAGQAVLALAEEATADDMVIALLSGGGSALLVAPALSHVTGESGLTLADKQALSKALLSCGASINEINVLRKHCSAVKGGQLARAVAPATLITLVLSDVIGSPLDVIASGPTVPDSSTWADAWAIVEKYDLAAALPTAVVARLQAGLRGEIADTPKLGDPIFERTQTITVADNRLAAEAALARAAEAGYNTLLLSTFVEGEAAEVGKVLAALGKEVQSSGRPIPAPACLVLGGETTVTLGSQPGQGGRNQELALSAALSLRGSRGITIVALATDGTDGPTDSAGGIGDGTTVARGERNGLLALDYLRRHDAYPYLAAVNDLLLTGPTRTNVNDLLFVFVEE
jgi:glycerate 2-kinase